MEFPQVLLVYNNGSSTGMRPCDSQTLAVSTVKPPKRGQFGTGGFVLSSEVVLSKRSTILYHIFCINVHIQGTTTSKESKDRARD